MYGYYTYIPINTKEILKRVTQEDIFKIVFEDVDLEKKYKAPYRDDKEAGCWFHYFEDTLYFTDFASNPINLTCFGFIEKVYNIPFMKALELINTHFKLGLGLSSGEEKEVKYEPVIIKKQHIEKRPKDILCYLREYEYKDIKFWGQYGISINNLKEDKVYPIKAYRGINRHNKPFLTICNDLAYCYSDFDDNKIKIYRPYNKEFKWFTNCTNNDIGGLKSVECVNYVIITKSYKDCRVLKNLGYNTIWFQNEGQTPSNEILVHLVNLFEKIYIWFDNDTAGMTTGKILYDKINNLKPIANIILIPPVLFRNQGIKDPSDYYKVLGKERLEEFIKTKIIN